MIPTPTLKKPLFDTTYGIYDKYVKMALMNPPLRVITEKHGQIDLDPQYVEENCEIIEAVYKIPDKPMRLYKISVSDWTKKKEEEWRMQKLSKESL